MFKEKLKYFRLKSNLTYEALSEKIKVSKSTIIKWEKGKGLPNIDTLDLLCYVFEVTDKELLSEEQLHKVIKRNRIKTIIPKIFVRLLFILIGIGLLSATISFVDKAIEQIKYLENSQYKDFFICMAKTPLSLTDNPKMVGAPKDFIITIKEIKISAGAKFLVCLTGDIMTMPGLPKVPLANKIDIDENGEIVNLS